MIEYNLVLQILTLFFTFISGFIMPLFKLYKRKIRRSGCVSCCSSCIVEEQTDYKESAAHEDTSNK